jgi:hypothetical protein
VPNELLTTTDASGNVAPKATLTAADWTEILGNDPVHYDYSGIDPHMIESYQPRSGVALQGSAGARVVGDEAPDWVTDGTTPERINLPIDLEYACVFPLVDSSGNPAPRNCDPNNLANSEADIAACSCSTAGLAADAVPSNCDATNPLQQDYAKAYPTIRELLLAKMMGEQGIVSSMCPIHVTDNAAGDDPLYGYRPAVTSIVDRMAPAFHVACLPQPIDAAQCTVLVTLPDVPGQSSSACSGDTTTPALAPADPSVLAALKAQQHAAFVAGGTTTDRSLFTTCAIPQVLPADFTGGSCKLNVEPAAQGWCYLTNTSVCAQQIAFSPSAVPLGAIVTLDCPQEP